MIAVTSTQSPPMNSTTLAQTFVEVTTWIVPVIPDLVKLGDALGVESGSVSEPLEKKVRAVMTRARAATAAAPASRSFFNSGFMAQQYALLKTIVNTN
jgi:hypothetical protein